MCAAVEEDDECPKGHIDSPCRRITGESCRLGAVTCVSLVAAHGIKP